MRGCGERGRRRRARLTAAAAAGPRRGRGVGVLGREGHLLLLHVDQLDAHGHGVAHVEHLVEKVQKVKGKKGKDAARASSLVADRSVAWRCVGLAAHLGGVLDVVVRDLRHVQQTVGLRAW